MNNCYSWGEDGESYVDEQDRSLPAVEKSLPTVRQPFQLLDQVIRFKMLSFFPIFYTRKNRTHLKEREVDSVD